MHPRLQKFKIKKNNDWNMYVVSYYYSHFSPLKKIIGLINTSSLTSFFFNWGTLKFSRFFKSKARTESWEGIPEAAAL